MIFLEILSTVEAVYSWYRKDKARLEGASYYNAFATYHLVNTVVQLERILEIDKASSPSLPCEASNKEERIKQTWI